jgi:hypothetical protein
MRQSARARAAHVSTRRGQELIHDKAGELAR